MVRPSRLAAAPPPAELPAPNAPPPPTPAPTGTPRSGAAARVGSSVIRDLLRLTERPGMLSLAGGLPAAATFPVVELAEASARLLGGDDAVASLQYAPTEGYGPLRAWIAADRGAAGADRVLVTTGSQQALELLARALLEPGDVVAVADPAYVGALQVFRLAGARILAVPADRDGLAVDLLADRLRAGARPRVVYTVSDFHNPTGATLTAERRRALAGLAERYGFVIVDDDPYGELRWAGTRPDPLRSLTDRVITLGSFSKILAPGLRVGYLVAAPEVIHDVAVLKQAADLHTAGLNQRLVHEVVSRPGFLPAHLERIRALYRRQAGALLDALRAHIGPSLDVAAPDGGLFLWGRLPAVVDTAALLSRAIDHGVAFVPGAAFALDRPAGDELRFSFATVTEEDAPEAAARLAAAVADHRAAGGARRQFDTRPGESG